MEGYDILILLVYELLEGLDDGDKGRGVLVERGVGGWGLKGRVKDRPHIGVQLV